MNQRHKMREATEILFYGLAPEMSGGDDALFMSLAAPWPGETGHELSSLSYQIVAG